jgi:hypothetical protein
MSETKSLFIVMHNMDEPGFGAWHPAPSPTPGRSGVEAVHAFTSADDAWRWLLDGQSEDSKRALRAHWKVVEYGPWRDG